MCGVRGSLSPAIQGDSSHLGSDTLADREMLHPRHFSCQYPIGARGRRLLHVPQQLIESQQVNVNLGSRRASDDQDGMGIPRQVEAQVA